MVIASYAQAIFDAVPLVHVVGTGGSELGRTLSQLGCNASFITAQTPIANAVRALDRLGGLAVIDDLGGIGRRSGEDAFRAFVRQLSASTRKDTAVGTWTDPTTLRVEKFDLYGVKVVTGALGANSTFPVPVLRVYARKPPEEGSALSELPFPTNLQELRDELHVWAMENAGRIDGLYRQSYSRPRSPQEALTAPLRVLADLLGNTDLSGQLQAALTLQEREPPEPMSPIQLVHTAVRSLIRQGYRKKLTFKQLMLELRLLAGDDPNEMSDTASPEWQEPRWVGRTLRAEKLIDTSAKDERRWLWGEQTRVVTLEPGFVADVLGGFDAQSVSYVPSVRGPFEFCLLRPCGECPYAGFCTMRPRKEKH